LSDSITKLNTTASRLRTINGAFVCENPSCVSVKAKKALKRRNTLSAMAVGRSGFASLLFGAAFPQFDPKVSQFNTDNFNQNVTSFFSATKTGQLSMTVILLER
jgi:hypothetical protein